MEKLTKKGMSRADMIAHRDANIQTAMKLYAEAKNQPEPRSQTAIYNEIAKAMNASVYSAMTWVQLGFRRKSPYALVPTYVRQGPNIDGVVYWTPVEAAQYMGVSSSTVRNWISFEAGPKPVVMKLPSRDGKRQLDNLLYRMDDVVAWVKTMEPRTDDVGKIHYFDRHGNPFKRANNQQVEHHSKSEVKRVATQKEIEFNHKVVAQDGKIHGIWKASRYINVPLATFTAALYGNLAGTKRGDIPHEVEDFHGHKRLVFKPSDLREWRVNWKGVKENNSRGAKVGWQKRRAAKRGTTAPVAAPVAKVEQKRKVKLTRRNLRHFNKAAVLAEMRAALRDMKRGEMKRARWMRVSESKGRYQKWYKGKTAFRDFVRDSMLRAIPQNKTQVAWSAAVQQTDNENAVREAQKQISVAQRVKRAFLTLFG